MSSEISANFLMDANVELVEGGTGVFDVTLDDKVIFSKNEKQRFPVEGEIVDLIREYKKL